jgi:hypothetical protein
MTDIVMNALWKLSKNRSHLKSANLIERLCEITQLSISDIRAILRQLSKDGAITGVSAEGYPLGNIHIIAVQPERTLSKIERSWKSALLDSGYAEGDITPLLKCADYLDGMSSNNITKLLRGITFIKNNLGDFLDEDPYVVSARYLLGSAKALKVLGDAFGIPLSAFRGRVAYAVVAGPADPEALIFIENVAPFEIFCNTPESDKIMAIATFGYSLGWNSLARDIRSEKLVHLTRKGAPVHLKNVIDNKPSFFWGDLDKEGLNIFMQLKKAIPSLQLSALYLPMIEAIKTDESHYYKKLFGKENQRVIKSNDALLMNLSTLCSERAVDQEIVTDRHIVELCRQPLVIQDIV